MSLELHSSSKHLHLPHRRHHHHHHHITYEDSELSMLMDPAYARPRSPLAQTTFLKGKSGEFHDPDYRHFPSTSSSTTTSGRTRRASSRASSVGRPSWELGVGEEMDEAEYQAYYNDGEEEVQNKTFLSVPSRSQFRRSTGTSYSSYSYPTSSPSSSITASPASYTSSLSDMDLDDHHPSSSAPSCHQKFAKRFLSITPTRASFFDDEHVHPAEVDWEDAEDTMSLPEERETEESASSKDEVSAAEAMKRQWQTTKFSVRFGVHQARRRVQKALGTGKRL